MDDHAPVWMGAVRGGEEVEQAAVKLAVAELAMVDLEEAAWNTIAAVVLLQAAAKARR